MLLHNLMEPMNRHSHQFRKHSRAGFTLVELLVVIAIIGMLIGILLPAVNGARESGRRVTCQNNLRQQGLGIQSFAQQYSEALPPIWLQGNLNPWENFSWRVAILPFIEEDARFDQLNQKLLPLDESNLPGATHIDIYSCPSSGSPRVINTLGPYEELGVGSTDYAAIFDVRSPYSTSIQTGVWYGASPPDAIAEHDIDSSVPGMAPEFSMVNPDSYSAEIRKIPSTFRRVRDGLSNTVLIVEQAGKPKRENRLGVPPIEAPGSATEGAWVTAEFASFAAKVNQDNHAGPFGYHSGASVVLCDGSVHFWPSEISDRVMFALLTREGSEIVGSNDW